MRKLNLDEQQVLASYAKHKSAQRVADEFGCSYQSIYRILHKHGIRRQKSKKHVKHLLPCGSKKCCPLAVVILRRCLGMKPSAIAAILGYTPNAVSNIISKRCPETIVRTHKEDFDIEQMVHEYRDLGMTSYELGPKYGVNPATIRKWMRSIGIHIGKENAPMRGNSGGNGKGAAILKDQCHERVVKKLVDDGDTLELVEYGEKLTLRCKACGHEFQKSKAGYAHSFTCPHCYEEALRRQAEEKARKKHEREQQLEAAREWRLSVPRICKECGETFYSEYEGAVYCSVSCRKRSDNRKAAERRKRHGVSSGSYGKRLKVKKNESTYDRTVTRAAVYKKYHGICCNCGCKTYLNGKWSWQRMELDHVVALNNNGTHTWDNVQLLCSRCNNEKADTGQMRLAF